ncbi:MAG TPA: SWIM zinc finger family protein, partial [Dyadobacter sp.]|nr:SWIM zinc finger family protein [Dyadobacter sp.]
MNLSNFQNHTSTTIHIRGREYYHNGAVNVLEEENGVWCAEVEGSEIYSVEVELSDAGEIEAYTCDCPHEADVCKHIVAVFYELKDKVKIIKLKPEKQVKKQALSFNALLEKVSFAELKQFVAQQAGNDKNLKVQFELYFAHKDENIDVEKKYSDLIKKAIRSSMSQGYVDYYSAGDLSGKVDNFLNKAQEAFENRNFKDASLIARVALKQLVEDVIPNADDSNGDIGDTIFNAITILESIAESEHCARGIKEN